MANSPKANAGIDDIAAYVPGKSSSSFTGKIHKLSSNETPLGPSLKAAQAHAALATELHLYPDGSASDLRDALAERYGLNPDRIVCGAGSDELLQLLAHAYLGEGDEAIHTEHGFLVYPIAIKSNGATPVVAREVNHTASVDEILKCVTARTKMVFLANPNNPTGTYIAFDEVKRLHQALPSSCVLVLDAAYAEYVRRNDYEAGIELVSENNNVVMTRTFSKAYGLAALRLGWAYCPDEMATVLNKIRGPFNVNAAAIAAGVAAVRDGAHLDQAVKHNDIWLEWLTTELEALGLKVTPSVGNFFLVHFGEGEGRDAAAADAFLASRGVIARGVAGYGLAGALRISIGTEEANREVVASLKAFISGQEN